MPNLRRLSGTQLISALKSFGFTLAGQKGSHVKLARIVDGTKQTLTLPQSQGNRHRHASRDLSASVSLHPGH